MRERRERGFGGGRRMEKRSTLSDQLCVCVRACVSATCKVAV